MGVVLVLLAILGILAYLIWTSQQQDSVRTELEEVPPTEAELLQARLDLHRIDRGVDLTLAKQEQRREAERVKQAIVDALDGDS